MSAEFGQRSSGAKRPLVIAHRGASGIVPENTLLAFHLAVEMGADMIELDVRCSRDGHLVVLHDPDVARTTDGFGQVHELDLEDLLRLDAGYRFSPDGQQFLYRGLGLRIPTLDEVLANLPSHIGINLEIKSSADGDARAADGRRIAASLAARCRREPALVERLLVSSFDIVVLGELRQMRPELRTALCVMPFDPLLRQLDRVCEAGLSALHPADAALGADAAHLIERAHRLGMAVNVWTVNSADRIAELAALGVDGIITDDPERAVQVLERARRAAAAR
uniref:Glycerophosphoryl diester phosphodiesterase n=1 Tax=Thermorudis sp. TaxID=1969470 RepID=A0A7C2WGK0_9BACT